MKEFHKSSFLTCGEVFNPDLPAQLDRSEPPIRLAEVRVKPSHLKNSCVLIKYSEFIQFSFLGLNPKLKIIYRLVKEAQNKITQILQEWEFLFESAKTLEGINLETNQPTVLNFCDCDQSYLNGEVTYRLEIVLIETNIVQELNITNKSITATTIRDEFQLNKSSKRLKPDPWLFNHFDDKNASVPLLPFVTCGKVLNPVLPPRLRKRDQPVVLTEVKVKSKPNTTILINFSGFVTSILRQKDFNSLVFQLVRKSLRNNRSKVLREWPLLREFGNDTNIKEPVVFNYCDQIVNGEDEYTYTVELVKAELSDQSSYNITQKSMTAQVYESQSPSKGRRRSNG
ncbi:DUF4489 domain-containing protein [Pseudalkalibacillus berkeleyi]|uniref:DUF4489 domain-containing protein n=1 Tax=Pseudalkalibacillus berkeleyi TaxID=1069813 RepID=A0ABS9H0R6_9BACL|nr:DUF4489 domain-containing protein [Pseudalkalibacillus berkeleyi]MCF6137433.1 DUF4489 domain-containing protein [Pseudalkalibacillus berkeleyi]